MTPAKTKPPRDYQAWADIVGNAVMMAGLRRVIPKHLRNRADRCLLVCAQAANLKCHPIALARLTYMRRGKMLMSLHRKVAMIPWAGKTNKATKKQSRPPTKECNMRRTWTATDVRTMKSMARRKVPAKKIAKTLKRTEGATRQKAFSLGVSLETRAGM